MEKVQPRICFKTKYNSYNNAVNYNRHIKFCRQNDSFEKTKQTKKAPVLEITLASGATLVVSGLLGRNYIRSLEKKHMFCPNTVDFAPIPETIKNVIQQIKTTTKDGLSLEHYYIPAKEGKKTVIFCHGIMHNATRFFDAAEFLHKNGYGVVLLEYRGFGKNPGTPSEKGFYQDFNSAADYLNQKGIKDKDIAIWGISLGGGVAVEAAKSNKFGGLILNSTFTSMKEETKHFLDTQAPLKNKFVQEVLKVIPPQVLPIETEFANLKKIKNITTKTLIMHAKDDDTIPYQMSEKLAKANPNAKLYIAEKGGHVHFGWTEEKILEFLNTLN